MLLDRRGLRCIQRRSTKRAKFTDWRAPELGSTVRLLLLVLLNEWAVESSSRVTPVVESEKGGATRYSARQVPLLHAHPPDLWQIHRIGNDQNMNEFFQISWRRSVRLAMTDVSPGRGREWTSTRSGSNQATCGWQGSRP